MKMRGKTVAPSYITVLTKHFHTGHGVGSSLRGRRLQELSRLGKKKNPANITPKTEAVFVSGAGPEEVLGWAWGGMSSSTAGHSLSIQVRYDS